MHSAMPVVGSSSTQEIEALRTGMLTGLPLVSCPRCGSKILELICGQGSKVPGAIFFKCEHHERDVPGTCPWFLFVNKYEKLLLSKGLILRAGTARATIAPVGSMDDSREHRVPIGCQGGLVEARKTELAPLLADVLPLKNGADGLDEKLHKLIALGQISAVCLVVMVVLVVVIMLVK